MIVSIVGPGYPYRSRVPIRVPDLNSVETAGPACTCFVQVNALLHTHIHTLHIYIMLDTYKLFHIRIHTYIHTYIHAYIEWNVQ